MKTEPVLPDMLKPRHGWSCEPCGVRMEFLREDDLETNMRNHLASDGHAKNTER